MYAVIRHGSHQYRVSPGDRLFVDRLDAEVGTTVRLDDVLMLGEQGDATSDLDALRKAVVTATVVAHRRGRKLRVMTFKPKKRHRRTLGYRSQLTELRIDDVQADGASAPAPRRAAARAESRPARAKTHATSAAATATTAAETAAQPKAEPASEPASEPTPAEEAPKPARRRAARKASEEQSTDGA